MTSMRVQCPNPRCGAVLSVPVRFCGRRVRCTCCRKVFRMPQLPHLGPARRTAATA